MIRREELDRVWETCKPRASGDDPSWRTPASHTAHVNPARAGMIRLVRLHGPPPDRKPRASGDDPAVEALIARGGA